jgi:Zn-dependent peptidase ImmA (M78 family)/DNA-binding XRE family transcriptional regulator
VYRIDVKWGAMNNFGQRLLSARKMSGLSLQGLAEKMNIEITKQALSQYEKGQTSPSSKVIISISNALDLPVDYFFKKSDVKLEHLEFRKRSSLSQKEIESVRFRTMDYLEKYLEIEELLNLDSVFTNPLKSNLVSSARDIEYYADELRATWSLGLDPLPDVISLLEENKVKVFGIRASEEFSGLASITDGVAVIVVNIDDEVNAVRKRLTALHELAHLILTFDEGISEKEIEHLCYSFASAVLFPESVFKEKLGKKRSSILLDELILLENYYGISVQAIMWRAHDLDLISASKFKEYQIWLSKTRLKKHKFGNYQSCETPMRFQRLVYKALSEEIISSSKAAALLNKPLSELDELTRII